MHKATTIAAVLWCLPMPCWAEVARLKARQTDNALSQLESLGIQLLTGVLDQSSSSTSTSSSSSASVTAASASASTTSSAASSAISTAASLSSAVSAASTASASSIAAHNKKNRILAIVLGTVLGLSVLVLLAALLWCCLSKRRHGRHGKGEKDGATDDELEPWQSHSNGSSKYITRIESWHEPKNSRNSSRGPPRGSQSHTSVLERDIPDVPTRQQDVPLPQNNVPMGENNVAMQHHTNVPMHQRNNLMHQNSIPMPPADLPSRYGTPVGPTPVPVANQQPRVNSHYGMIQIGHDENTSERGNPFDDPRMGHANRSERHSLDDGGRNPRHVGYTPYLSTQSSLSLDERIPTPLFGSGKTAGEYEVPTSVKRKSIGSGGPAELSDTASPPPLRGSNGPWVPPKNPMRRRESIPGSPLAHSFDFGFGEGEGSGGRRDSKNDSKSHSRERYSMPGGWKSQASIDAHQRF